MLTRARTFDSKRLRSLRTERGLSRSRLAALVGVSERQIVHYESGGQSPSPAHARRLLDALHCPPEELTGVGPGTETLADLRYIAGLTVEQAAQAADTSTKSGGVRVSRYALGRGELGHLPNAWLDLQAAGRVVTALATVYSQPVRVVHDAWTRTFPDALAPIQQTSPCDDQPVPTPRGSARARQNWEQLNDRQRSYLTAIYHEDQDAEVAAAVRRANFGSPGPAAVWRKLPFSIKAPMGMADYTAIQRRLRQSGEHDPGAGATLVALERRGLLAMTSDEVELMPFGMVPRVRVEMTRSGRACARAGLGEPATPSTPAHLLSEWLWKNLVRVAETEPEGLADEALWGKSKFYLGVGFRTAGRPSRGFIDSLPVHAGSGPDSYVQEFRWHLTDTGRRHVADNLAEYQRLYPQIMVNTLA